MIFLIPDRPPQIKPGDYVTLRSADTEAERADCEETLRRQGCKSVRFEQLPDGRLQAHGYLAQM